jgi:ATP-binding cassette subfamily F protein uup
MATLLTCNAISKHFGARDLFHGLSISFADGEHVGFLGPNGAGKTTFLRILAGLIQADSGEISRRRAARIGFLPQEDRFAGGATVETTLAAALDDQPWEAHDRDTQVNIMLSKFGFDDARRPVEELSGGWRKRLALAREIIQRPDLLLMDEPTNHLDLAGIQWLEELLAGAAFAFVIVSHDRYLLESATNRVVELNPIYPESYFSVSGNYSKFLEKRADFLEAQQAQQASLANIVRREAAFLKSNSKAQRTKSKARIEEAHRLHEVLRDLQHRNAQTQAAGIDFSATGRKSRKLLEARGLAKSLGNKLLFKDVSLLLSPGTRLGLLGANGSGKTTLIRVLTGDLPPDAGRVDSADNLRVVVFDQRREQLPQDVPLRRALVDRGDSVDFRGQSVHITSWARRFLFRVDQLDMPVSELSGGEQARVLIARMMLRPADVLILDEPTNDLDIGSLDVLEDSLRDFPGAIVLVTHDRFMLDRICTEMLSLDGNGRVGRYGDWAQWQAAQVRRVLESDEDAAKTKPKKMKTKPVGDGLTASERKELQEMESVIQEAEERLKQCALAMAHPEIAGDLLKAQERWAEWQAAKNRVEALYARWEELEARKRSQDRSDNPSGVRREQL